MITTILQGAGKTAVVEREMPQIAPDEVLVKVLVCGVCASEYHAWAAGDAGKTLGHEVVGIVEKLGRDVTGFKPGDRVSGMMWGGFSQYTTAKAAWIVKVPDGLTDEEAMGEPLACLMSGATRTPIEPGQRMAIVGCGYMGLGFLQLMRIKGAAGIIAVDPRAQARQNALRFGASEAYSPDEVPMEYLSDHFDDEIFTRGVEVVAEAAGSQAAINLAGRMTRSHGVLSIVGYHVAPSRIIDMKMWNWKALTVINAHERRMWICAGLIEKALRLISEGRFDARGLTTHRYRLDQIDKAYTDMRDKPEGYIKGVIRVE